MSSPQPLAQQQQQTQRQYQHSQASSNTPTPTPTPTLSLAHPHPHQVGRLTLPNRDVTITTIEHAYVRFIFYCNPALPLDADTTSLRESFRNPPRSGGKSFCPFAIFELVKKFYSKEIKTWTELTTTLGVEPPDPSKDESAQKVAQYGVRLKKWMNSMHVKAFFEYLMNIQNDYWTRIPSDPNPIALPVRDGVAVEDDMALRALLPYIRPKRGRKRPDGGEDVAGPPVLRQRLSPVSAINGILIPDHPWSASDTRAPPPPSDPSRLGAPIWAPNESVQTPTITRWPNSAVTPSTRSSFWEDALEPRSAVTSKSNKPSTQRRGAKNVSSAWKPGGPDSGTKTRGRPPINRTPVEAPNPPVTSWAPTPESNPAEPNIPKEVILTTPDLNQMPLPSHSQAMFGHQGPVLAPLLPAISTTLPTAARMGAGAYEGPRPPRPNITLQVPERPGGSVRLATPPPPPPLVPSPIPSPIPPPLTLPNVRINGQQVNSPQGGPPPETLNGNGSGSGNGNGWDPFTQPAMSTSDANGNAGVSSGTSCPGDSSAKDIPEFYFDNMDDRSNIEPLISYFSHVLHNADWIDRDGNQQVPAGMDECAAMVNATVEHMYKNAESSQAFLINLAALCGAKMLLHGRPRCYRVETAKDVYTYYFDWQYRFGNIQGEFTMMHSVPLSMWQKPAPGEAGQDTTEPLSGDYWRRKYEFLMEEVERQDREKKEIQNNVMKSLGGAGTRQ